MPKNIHLFICRVSKSQVEIAGDNYCFKNNLCSIFVVNDTKNFLRYDNVVVQLSYSDIMLNRIFLCIIIIATSMQ